MQQQIQNWLVSNNVAFYPEYLALALALLGILICCVGVSYVAYLVLRRIMQNVCAKSSFLFVRSLSETQLFTHINYLVVAIVLQQLLVLWLQPRRIEYLINFFSRTIF